MPSTDAYAAVRLFLEGTENQAGDVQAGVAAEQANLLREGAVRWSREGTGTAPRDKKVPDPYVELVPGNRILNRPIGIGFVERGIVVDARAFSRRKDVDEGPDQLDIVEDIQRALVFRYDGRSNLNITGINFRFSEAEEVAIDETPGSADWARSVTRLTFWYTEAMESNA